MMKTSTAASRTHLLLPAGAVARLAVECSHAAQLLQVCGLLRTRHRLLCAGVLQPGFAGTPPAGGTMGSVAGEHIARPRERRWRAVMATQSRTRGRPAATLTLRHRLIARGEHKDGNQRAGEIGRASCR